MVQRDFEHILLKRRRWHICDLKKKLVGDVSSHPPVNTTPDLGPRFLCVMKYFGYLFKDNFVKDVYNVSTIKNKVLKLNFEKKNNK